MAQDPNLNQNDIFTYVLGFIGGTGNMGTRLCRNHAKAGFQVYLGSRDASKAEKCAAEIIAKSNLNKNSIIGVSNEDCAKKADIIFWCVQGTLQERHALLKTLCSNFKDKIVVDITNILYLYDEKAWGQQSSTLQNKEVTDKCNVNVKWCCAWKNTFAALLDDNPSNDNKASIFVCSDDKDACQIVVNIINTLNGFQGTPAGYLAHTKIVELLGPRYIGVMDQLNCKDENKKRHSYWQFYAPK